MKPIKLFDAHLHIIDPRFPLIPNQGYLPEPFTCSDYKERMQDYDLCGGAIVSGSFQGFDQAYLLDALKQMGPQYVGVTNLQASASDQQILELDAAGVRAVRFNLMRGGSETISELENLAHRINELCNWHVELYVDSGELTDLYKTLTKLPAISIDHLGVSESGHKTLLKLVEKGARVKASGFGRINFDVVNTLIQIYSINSTALMFGTDLPSTRAPRLFDDHDIYLVIDSFDEEQVKNIFYNNALSFYKLKHRA